MTFKPSEVCTERFFVGTFRKAEVEATAAVIVGVLAANGDEWRPATFKELGEGFKRLTDEPGYWRDWFNNPFITIDIHRLVEFGFAECPGDMSIKFTDEGLRQLERWVRP